MASADESTYRYEIDDSAQIEVTGINSTITSNSSSLAYTDVKPLNDNQLDSQLGINNIGFCSEYIEFGVPNGTLKAFQIIGYALFIVKILVPLVLLVMTTIDLVKAMVAGELKDDVKAVVRRIIIAILIFLLPTILDIILSFVDGVSETINDANLGNCQTCLLHPLSSECKAHNINGK